MLLMGNSLSKLMQGCHSYEEISLNGGIYEHGLLLYKEKTNQMKIKEMNALGKVVNIAPSYMEWPVEIERELNASHGKHKATTQRKLWMSLEASLLFNSFSAQ